MKLILSIICLFTATISFSQEWTPKEKAVLTKYSLTKNDHRGIEFSSDSSNELHFPTLQKALEYFLENKNVIDLISIYVDEYPENQQLKGAVIGIKEIVDHYILLSTQN